MRKLLLSALIGASVLSSGLAAAATTVSGGTVHFKGEIVNAACAVSTNSADQTVNLGQYRTANFTAVGAYTSKVPFTIKLEDCDTTVSTTAAVAFNGSADSTDNTVLSTSNITNGGAGAASGVGIEISDSKGTVLPPNGSTFSAAQTLVNGNGNTLNFTARYKSTLEAVTPGQADADATFTMQYE
ncbi:type-1 fimbrial protein subunit A [Brenneria goodwinii]|uniref:Type 1 fimbriae major subunit FimA n=1 Tax=Brenneria goodwinii TaxID=1109412 RepID=A0A0G4K3A9_9GAMM|nr:type 1 fimbrial major subunit FimA [Brenneria goodwinii]ATA24616.1 type-1 fimbrial protein subunit A [Brenneria goodwinii]RLM17789.1 type-1 fimbrial protein subunit A [Brenneria goodwinii]CPR21586.1 type 1 fimbriae major subunit FimA [Brenneria goodwinii]